MEYYEDCFQAHQDELSDRFSIYQQHCCTNCEYWYGDNGCVGPGRKITDPDNQCCQDFLDTNVDPFRDC